MGVMAMDPIGRKLTMRSRAKRMAKNQTPPEQIVWNVVQSGVLGHRFRKQAVWLGRYIVDFYCHDLRLALEIDGKQHEKQLAYDTRRDEALRALNIVTVRIPAWVVFQGEKVARVRIEAAVRQRTRHMAGLPSQFTRRSRLRIDHAIGGPVAIRYEQPGTRRTANAVGRGVEEAQPAGIV